MLAYDRPITISSAGSRTAAHWLAQTLYISGLYQKLQTPTRGAESLEQYLALPRGRQDALKDVGGFVAGALKENRRKAANVLGRDVVTLDLDHIPAGGTDDVLRRVDSLGCGYCVYSTRKHSPAAPRLRVLLPTDRTVTADEYEPVARMAAKMLGMELCDPSTFEASRLMYWPSCCADSQYIYLCGDKAFLSADGVLGLYADWRDCGQWPQVPGAVALPKLAQKQGDPLGKPGVVGAFCRVYGVLEAAEKFLPGTYEPVDSASDRFTFTGGSTTGGAVLYEDGKFLYSHHSTDPAGGRLCNAFDLVRLHLYGNRDDDAKPETPVNKLPSFKAMCEAAVADIPVAELLNRERYENATQDFAALTQESGKPEGGAVDTEWMRRLQHTASGKADCTIDNAWLILENDPLLRGKFALNEFASRAEVFGALPWSPEEKRRMWEDNDNQGAYWYFEKVYFMTKSTKIDGALSLHGKKHAFDDVVSYLNGLSWDGIPRLDTLLIRYLGARDTPYTRAVTRKAFLAAVARALVPGIKFEVMTVLSGAQGIGKSTLLRKMSKGWFTDSLRDFTGKDASEMVQGVWIVEIGELEAFHRSEINRVKQFLSQQVDRYRAAYAKNVKDCPRRCVFFGTSNHTEYLQDLTGNRRFWPVDVGVVPSTHSVFRDLDAEVDQLWAEAAYYWQQGESLILPPDLEAAAKEEQETHRELSSWEGVIHEFVEREVPEDWAKWPLDKRRVYWGGGMQGGGIPTVPRARICALEVWCEALNGDFKGAKHSDISRISSVIRRLEGWTQPGKVMRFGYCGPQRGFESVTKSRNKAR